MGFPSSFGVLLGMLGRLVGASSGPIDRILGTRLGVPVRIAGLQLLEGAPFVCLSDIE